MGRIRSIKPEFPQSETIGRLSRDARLLFVQLWTFADDSGRARGAFQLLASMLFPYDSDAPELIGGWLSELEREGCIIQYEVDGSKYLQISNWLKHQKIEKPSASKIPSLPEPSPKPPRHLPEASVTDLGSRIKERDQDKDQDAVPPAAASNGQAKPPDAELYDRGKQILGTNSGGMIRKLLVSRGGNIPVTRAALETASQKSNPREYIGAIISSRERESIATDDLIS
jgi:hypothetical protein